MGVGFWLPAFTLLTTVEWEPASNVDIVNDLTKLTNNSLECIVAVPLIKGEC